MQNYLEKLFFKSLVTAIVKEEDELNELFRNSDKEYQKFAPAGVSCLFETTFVYITIKQLLKDIFPLLISWEHPYPNDNYKKADMALLNSFDSKDINTLIEFKIWKTEEGKEIIKDLDKLNTVENIDKYMVFIEYTDNKIEDNKKYLENELFNGKLKDIEIKIIEYTNIETSFFDSDNSQNVQKNMNIYLVKA